MVWGNGSEADINCRQAARRVERQRPSTYCRIAASARPALRHRKTPRDRRRFGRRGVECSETDCRRQPEGRDKRSQPGARRKAAGRGGRIKRWSPSRCRPTRFGATTSRSLTGTVDGWRTRLGLPRRDSARKRRSHTAGGAEGGTPAGTRPRRWTPPRP